MPYYTRPEPEKQGGTPKSAAPVGGAFLLSAAAPGA